MRLRLSLFAFLLSLVISAEAGVVASSLPFKGTPDWTDTVFAGTSMARAGDGASTTLTTAEARGVWFGWGEGYADPAPAWRPGNPAAGNYLQLGTRFSAGAKDWSAYFYDTTYEAAILFGYTNCSNDCYALPPEPGVRLYHADTLDPSGVSSTFVPIDLAQHHVYEVLLKGGRVTYHIDGEVAFTGAALLAPLSSPLVVIGDGSGSTLSGAGAMTLTGAIWDNAPGFDTLPGQSFANANAIANAAGATLTVRGTFRNLLGGSLASAGTLDVLATGRLLNGGTFNGMFGGVVNNAGRFAAALGGASFGNAGTFTNLAGGRFENEGSATNHAGGAFTNLGHMAAALGGASFRNEGTLGNALGGVLENRGTLTNAAGGAVTNGGALANLLGGTMTNAGTLTNALGGVMANHGALTNALGGVMTNHGTLINQVGGRLTNRGALTNALGGVIENLGTLLGGLGGPGASSLANVGTLNNRLGGAVFGGVAFTNASANTVNNEGSFTVDGLLTNTATGVFNNLVTGTLDVIAGGTLINDGLLANAGSITNAGDVQVGAGGSITGTGTYSQQGGSTRLDGSLAARRIDIDGGTLSGQGSIVTTAGLFVADGAALAPGGVPGESAVLSITGDLHLGGALRLDLGRALGLLDGDRVDVNGQVLFLDGAEVLLDFDFLPRAGDSFELIRAGGFAGLELVNWRLLGAGLLAHGVSARNGSLMLWFAGPHTAVSAPETGALFAAGALALLAARRHGITSAR